MATLDSFYDSVQWSTRGDFSERDVEEAKLSVFSQVSQSDYLVLALRVYAVFSFAVLALQVLSLQVSFSLAVLH